MGTRNISMENYRIISFSFNILAFILREDTNMLSSVCTKETTASSLSVSNITMAS